jgi:hypothetical protein
MRRLLVMIVVGMLVLTALAGLSAPVEESSDEPAPPPRPAAPLQTVSLKHPAPEVPPVRRVRQGSRVVVRVSSSVAGQVEVEGLGLLQPVAPVAPASFDVLATRPGRYQVVMLPVDGERRVIGTVVVAG